MSILFNRFAFLYDGFMKVTGLGREERLLRFLGDVREKKVADIGGGTGSLACILTNSGAHVTIIDPSEAMTKIAVKKDGRLKVLNAKAESIPLGTNEFDFVCMKDCLHHMTEQQKALEEAVRILKPGGKILIQEFNPFHPVGKIIFLFERMAFEKTRMIRPDDLVQSMLDKEVRGKIIPLNTYEYLFCGHKPATGDSVYY